MQVYVIERTDGLVKIGKSGNPTKRIHALDSREVDHRIKQHQAARKAEEASHA